jgi:type II secretory pathway pseudopilin PulG
MAALLVAIAVMAVLMTAAMPVWRHQAQREKEAELIFRGEQWVRGFQQFQRRNGPGSQPTSLDMLVQQRMVRKKWKDPITGEDFVPVYAGQQQAGQGAQPGTGTGRGTGTGQGTGTGAPPRGAAGQPPRPGSPTPGAAPGFGQGGVGGGIMGVRSKSTETSIRSYKGATRYDQWSFLSMNTAAGPGAGGPGRGAPGGGGTSPRPGTGGTGRGGGTNNPQRGGIPRGPGN